MAASAISPRLTILGGPRAGQELALDEAVDNILVGSDPSCRFHVDLPGVSPIHARLWVDWQGLTVYDTGAPEGIYLNDDRVERSSPVRNGDILWLGPPGGDGVVMIQCRVPPRSAVTPPGQPAIGAPLLGAADAPGDATATLVEAQPPADEPAGGAWTETVAFTTDATLGAAPEETISDEAAPDSVGAAETVWITPDATAAGPTAGEPVAEPEPEPPEEIAAQAGDQAALETTEATLAAPGAEDPAGPDFGAESVAPDTDAPRATGFALADDNLETADEPVKFEIDEPPQALAGQPAPFEEDIEEPTPAPEASGEPAETRAAETVVVPPPTPAPRPPVEAPPASLPPREPPPAAPPVPRAVAPRPVPAATAARPAAAGSAVGRYVALAAVALIVLAAGGFGAYWLLLRPGPAAPPAPTAAATPPPATLAPAPIETPPAPVPTADVEEAVTIVRTPPAPASPTPPVATPGARPVPTPKPATPGPVAPASPAPDVARAQLALQVAALVAQGDGALGEHRYDAAAALYAQALQLDPQNAQASAGRARAQAGAAAARRTFVAGRSLLVGAKSGKKGPAGFEEEDVQVAKAPDYSGRLEFEASPRSLKPGDSYSVRIFLVNDGKKDFKIAAFSAVTSANGEKSGGPLSPNTREVATQGRELLQELSGVWKEGTSAWSLEAAVTSSHGEIVRNTLTWK